MNNNLRKYFVLILLHFLKYQSIITRNVYIRRPVHFTFKYDFNVSCSLYLDKRQILTTSVKFYPAPQLAHGILENTYDTSNQIETVLSYSFDQMQYWGTHEGLARGLPSKVYEKGSTIPTDIRWGVQLNKKINETKSVSSNLPPGTAINVTLMGNYVTVEAPYRAKLFAFYQGITESVSRNITAEVRKSYLKDIKLEYSPVYWIENGTFIPTTTTTTTTSTTTHPTTTKHSDAKPMSEPPIVLLSDIGRSVVSTSADSSKSKSDSNGDDINENIIPNESRENYAENLKHMKDAASPGTSHSTRLYCWTNSILILLILVTVRVFG